MTRDILNIDTSFPYRFGPEELDLQGLEAIRLLLNGTSIIDWHKLDMRSIGDVNQFLRVQLLDPDDMGDMFRLRFVFNQAITYLEEHLQMRLPKELRQPDDVRDIFLVASKYTGRFRRKQTQACMILKLMHVINHMEAADLKFQSPISEALLLDRAEKRIIRHANQMRESGFNLLAFYGSRKTRTSMITKLLAKQETIAATIFDKLRFRIVVEKKEEIVPVLAHLTKTLFPFNYVIPGESHNNLIHLKEVVKERPHYVELAKNLQRLHGETNELAGEINPYSGQSYRTINFIVDFPVRVDAILPELNTESSYMLGQTVFVMVEFQLVDKDTDQKNEQGENAHTLYKVRQRKIVEGRLLKGSLYKDK